MMPVSSSDIEALVSITLEKQFPKIKLVRVIAREGEDSDGDDIVEITVVFEAEKGDFEPAEVPKFLNVILPKLMAEKHSPFPIFSFVSKSDWGKRKPATA